ncbi:MAG: class I SAM-dependent methyltransferase [Pirellulaceae bacterium]
MLERVLEPEAMTGSSAQQYDEMDHSQANQSFVDDLVTAVNAIDGVWLDLGTGTAQIPILLCQTIEEVRVLASDLSQDMLELARYRIEVDGLITRIQLSNDDAKQLEFEDGGFSGVMSNSIVHHVADPKAVISEAVRVVAAGGALFFRDLVRPKDESEVQELVQRYAGHENDEQQRLFAESFRAALTCEEMQDLIGELGFARETVRMTSDRHWTWSTVAS